MQNIVKHFHKCLHISVSLCRVCPSSLLTSPAGFSPSSYICLHVASCPESECGAVWKTGRICFRDDKPRARTLK